jgi:hypothetical protein
MIDPTTALRPTALRLMSFLPDLAAFIDGGAVIGKILPEAQERRHAAVT